MTTAAPSKPARKPAQGVTMKVIWKMLKNINVLRMLRAHEKVHSVLVRVNGELSKLPVTDPLYPRRLEEFNQAAIALTQSRFYTDQAVRSKKKDWKKAFAAMERSKALGEALLAALQSGSREPIPYQAARIQPNHEITFADDVPLIPEVNPIIILQGDDYELGYQYAQQAIEIFGQWIFQSKAGKSKTFSAAEMAELRLWEDQLRQHAPEILDMCRGWAAGATDAGVPMAYEDAVDVWTGHYPPATKYLGKGEAPFDMPPLACSGMAAWGRATKDGRLVTGSSGDHDCTYMATVVVFPKTGNSFIFSPFSVVGDVPVVGNTFMMGHPGMNDKGLAYVHHGGVPKLAEDPSEWGYGLRRGASIFHVLRFANTALEAREMERSFPVGDAGKDSAGTAGGFYADSTYGYIWASRKNPVILHEAGVLGETDFLYANNAGSHPDMKLAGWMKPFPQDWVFEAPGGWRPRQFTPPSLTSIKNKGKLAFVNSVMSLMYDNSFGRNQFAFKMLKAGMGQIDVDYMKMVYRTPGTLPEGPWEKIAEGYKKTGYWGQVTTGHAGNALVAMMKPDRGPNGVYALCVGPIRRGLPAHAPYPHSGPIHNETNAFWQVRLASGPEDMAVDARKLAESYLQQATKAISEQPGYEIAQEWLRNAQQALSEGCQEEEKARQATGRAALYAWSKALRCFTRAQVRAQQVTQALKV